MACRWDIFKNRCVLKIGFKSASFGKRELLCIILSENKRCTITLYHIVQSFFFALPATFFPPYILETWALLETFAKTYPSLKQGSFSWDSWKFCLHKCIKLVSNHYISFFLPLLHHGHHPHYIQHPDHDHSHPLSYIKGAHGHPHGHPRVHHGHPLILSPLWKVHISQSFRGDLDLIWLETLCLHLQCQIVTNGMMMGYLSNFDTLGTMLMTLG